jgi:hypothetical protein
VTVFLPLTLSMTLSLSLPLSLPLSLTLTLTLPLSLTLPPSLPPDTPLSGMDTPSARVTPRPVSRAPTARRLLSLRRHEQRRPIAGARIPEACP